MSFKMKYNIEKDYIEKGTLRRSGIKITGGKPKFGVLHDTGNTGSTAKGNVNYYKNSANVMEASAHTFIDGKDIIECIPMTTGTPEKAWHVIYDKPLDNKMFGDDANDIAVGIELCYGGSVDFEEAYKRYVWYSAYCAYKFGFEPTQFVGHHILDPQRKTDPVNALSKYKKTYEQLLKDIVDEYNECTGNTSEKDIEEKELEDLEFTSPTLKKYLDDRLKSPATMKLVDETAQELLGYKTKLKNGRLSDGDLLAMAVEIAVKCGKEHK